MCILGHYILFQRYRRYYLISLSYISIGVVFAEKNGRFVMHFREVQIPPPHTPSILPTPIPNTTHYTHSWPGPRSPPTLGVNRGLNSKFSQIFFSIFIGIWVQSPVPQGIFFFPRPRLCFRLSGVFYSSLKLSESEGVYLYFMRCTCTCVCVCVCVCACVLGGGGACERVCYYWLWC